MRIKKIMILACILASVFSCNDKNNTKDVSKIVKEKEVLGTSHFLENDGIQMQLPKAFKRFSSASYEAKMKDFLSGKYLEIEQNRLRHLRKIDGNLYIFYDEATNSTITINTLPYQPLTKDDAKTILADIIRDQNEIVNITKTTYTKITTSYNDAANLQVLKSIFKIANKKKNQKTIKDRFLYKYYIASKDKYIIIDANTSLNIDFDNYLEQMRL